MKHRIKLTLRLNKVGLTHINKYMYVDLSLVYALRFSKYCNLIVVPLWREIFYASELFYVCNNK